MRSGRTGASLCRMAKNKRKQGTGTGAAHNVFISWSGDRSKAAAQALRDWLPVILQAARPWMSDTDIEKGSVGLDEVARALDMKVGIICLTPENLSAEWILFEAGGLAKAFDDKTRVCPYLLGGLQKQGVKRPLGMFQATTADKDDTRRLVHTINKHLDADPVPEAGLNSLFDKMWPELEAKLDALPKPSGAAPPKRTTEDMLAELLEVTKGLTLNAEAERKARQWTLFQTGLTAGETGITGIKLSDAMAGEPARGWIHKTAEEQAERVRLIDQIRSNRSKKKTPE